MSVHDDIGRAITAVRRQMAKVLAAERVNPISARETAGAAI